MGCSFWTGFACPNNYKCVGEHLASDGPGICEKVKKKEGNACGGTLTHVCNATNVCMNKDQEHPKPVKKGEEGVCGEYKLIAVNFRNGISLTSYRGDGMQFLDWFCLPSRICM